jgi:hypothetical protein
MNTFDKNMEKIFDVTPVEEKAKPLVPVVDAENKPAVSDNDLKQDLKDAYGQTKDNLQELLDHGKEAMEEIYQIAKAGQHPRAFEVYGTLLKNLVDANKELLNVQKQMREMDGKKKDGVGDTKINNAVFVGSTDELNKLIKGNKQ